jgi:hypothetical protein
LKEWAWFSNDLHIFKQDMDMYDCRHRSPSTGSSSASSSEDGAAGSTEYMFELQNELERLRSEKLKLLRYILIHFKFLSTKIPRENTDFYLTSFLITVVENFASILKDNLLQIFSFRNKHDTALEYKGIQI